MKTVVLDFDDFSVLNNKLDLLLKLKEIYPKLKVSLFTIPYDIAYESKVTDKRIREKALEDIKKQLDWLEIIPHGLIHVPREMEYTGYGSMRKFMIPFIDACFKKDGLPYVRGFKAPHWEWSADVVRALDKEGWWGAINVHYKDMLKTKKYYVYQFNADKPFWESKLDILKIHGHITYEMQDSIERCFTKLQAIPKDAEFKFASEVLDTK